MNTFTCFSRNFSVSSRLRALCWPRPDYGPVDVQRTTILNGVRVCSSKIEGAQIGACTIMFQGGSRYENDDELGVSHFLRPCSAASGCGYSSYSKTRVLQQLGAYISVNNDRQSIAYTVRCPTSVFNKIKYYLMDMSARCCYSQHDVELRKDLIKQDLQRITPDQLVMDLVQKACWGGGLHNSVFCEEARIGGMSAETMNWFTTSNFKSDGCSVASVGLPFEEVLLMAEKIETRREKPPNARRVRNSWPRRGFEYHDLGPGSDTWIAVAVPGCGTNDLLCLMKHALVAAACGAGAVRAGQHAQDRVAQPPLGLLTTDCHTDYRAFNLSYCDTGVFGILVKTRSVTAKAAAYSAVKFLQNVGSLTNPQIEVGRARLRVDVAVNDGDCVRLSEGLALQMANNCVIDTASSTIDMINTIPTCEVTAVAQSLASKKCQMAIAVVGDVQQVPDDRRLLGC